MIDLEAVKEVGRGQRFDRLTALLIGVVALLTALLIVTQGSQSLAQARAQSQSRRSVAELSTRIVTSGIVSDYGGVHGQLAILGTLEGLSRSQAGVLGDDPADISAGDALAAAGTRLQAMAADMGMPPGSDTPLDAYAASVIGSTIPEMQRLVADGGAFSDAADAAGANSGEAVLGLSAVALAGVFAGLAAVVGSSRTGRSLLALGWVSAAAAACILALAADVGR
jgi:hypothetical protein